MPRYRMLFAAIAVLSVLSSKAAAFSAPETVRFASADGSAELTGYVFTPAAPGRYPAVVMMHGRSGSYSTLKRGQYNADALSLRHMMWGRYWAQRGYIAIHVDSFGPRGRPAGFPKHSYKLRPPEVSEVTVRPLDAYGALAYLRSRSDVDADRIGLLGWSNGAMSVLSTISPHWLALAKSSPTEGFRAAIALYPSCRTQAADAGYRPYSPLMLTAAELDDEVSPTMCRRFAEALRSGGAEVQFHWYEGAHHSYDDPGKTKQKHAPNGVAMRDTLKQAEVFFSRHLKP